MTLFTINILIVSLLAEKKSVFKSPAVLENENDPNRDTIYGEFIVFFDKDCIAGKKEEGTDIIKEFLDQFKCYRLNEDIIDLYPDIIDHWIYMDVIENCQEEDVKIEWYDYCMTDVQQDEVEHLYGSNQCLSRSVESALWSLNAISPEISNGVSYIQFGSTTDPNMDIIVMDTGIEASHPQFSGITIQRIFDGYVGHPLHYHGSHVTGTIVGKDYGVVRIDSNIQIRLIDVRIFGLGSTTSSAIIINGLDSIITHLISNPGKKFIINMSWGGTGNRPEIDTRLATIKALGGISFAAAGNANRDASNVTPARSPDTICVGAHNSQNQRSLWPELIGGQSNYGNVIDIWAPGTDIKSANVGGGSIILDGTSMAAPLVAGIAANILANNPNLDFNGIKQRLLDYAIYDIDDRLGNTNLPRVQVSCEEYGLSLPPFTLTSSSDVTKCLDVDFNQNDNVYLHWCHFGSNQKWKRGSPDTEGFYPIISLYNNECLDAQGIVGLRANIYTYPCHYGDNQKWKIDGDILRVKANGGIYCLDYANTNAHIWSCDTNNVNQKVKAISETIIRSKYHSNRCLDINPGWDDNVFLNDCNTDKSQRWRKGIPDSDGYYYVISEYHQECLDAYPAGNGHIGQGHNIWTHPCHLGDNQKWKIDGMLIKNKASGGYWCLDGGDGAVSLNAHIWSCDTNNGNQQFEFPGFEPSSGSTSSALSINDMLEMDHFEFTTDKNESMEYFKRLYVFGAIGIILIINVLCWCVYFCKQNNKAPNKGYQVTGFDSSSDLENPDQ